MLKKTYSTMPATSGLKPVEWIGSARTDLQDMPEDVRKALGYALYEVQRGKHPPNAKWLKGDLRGLIELIDDFDSDTYRAICTVQLASVVYVLHVFQKKSTRGIGMAKRDLAVIRARWQRAKQHHMDQFAG
jgi:phage-related protein